MPPAPVVVELLLLLDVVVEDDELLDAMPPAELEEPLELDEVVGAPPWPSSSRSRSSL